jgi:hypothetical protein
MHTEVGAREVARLIGIPYRTLMHWVSTGLVTPEASVQLRGRRRVRFRPDDIREVRLIAELRRHLSGPQLREALNYLRRLALLWTEGVHQGGGEPGGDPSAPAGACGPAYLDPLHSGGA